MSRILIKFSSLERIFDETEETYVCQYRGTGIDFSFYLKILLSILLQILLSWDTCQLMNIICMSGCDVGVYGCNNMGILVVWVMVLTFCIYFMSLILTVMSTTSFYDWWF